MSEPIDIYSRTPFFSKALDYFDHGFFPIHIPEGKKFPPPKGLTGGKRMERGSHAQYIEETLGDSDFRKCNIGIKLDNVEVDGKRYDLVGIDVDHYSKGATEKTGDEQLHELEERLGNLPDTWTSSARDNGKSGIKWYLAPPGLGWRGKSSESIDTISHHHRYAVVWPSVHDSGSIYYWYEPGVAPAGVAEAYRGVPDPSQFALLPEAWIDELSRNRMDWTDKPLDIDISVDDLKRWVTRQFKKHGAEDGSDWCEETKARYEHWKNKIDQDPSSHDKITGAQWQFALMGLTEGHKGIGGVQGAMARITQYWYESVMSADKRGQTEAKREIFRSLSVAYRKIKWRHDELKLLDEGISFPNRCSCFEDNEETASALGVRLSVDAPMPSGKAQSPDYYLMNDRGNAEHLADLYPSELLWIDAHKKWAFWNGNRWLLDSAKGALCFHRVGDRQRIFAETLAVQAQELLEEPDVGANDSKYKGMSKLAGKWKSHALLSGNVTRINSALESFRSIPDKTIPAVVMDAQPHLLGVANGVIELLGDGFRHREALQSDMVLCNTGVKYLPLEDQAREGGERAANLDKFLDFLNLVQPNLQMRMFLQKVMGYCLYGKNTERLFLVLLGKTSTGKSTFLNIMMSALGTDYSGPVNMSMFKEDIKLNPALAKSLPRRIITTTEAAGGRISAETIKRITGEDELSAEMKGSNEIVERIPAFVPVIATNAPPQISGSDAALMERRLMVIPFDNQIPESDGRTGANIVEHCSEAALAWMVEGWIRYISEGLERKDWPGEVVSQTKEFSAETDPISMFVSENLVRVERGGKGDIEECYVAARRLFEGYLYWAENVEKLQEAYRLSQTKFSRRMKSLGFVTEVRRMGDGLTRVYYGLSYKNESEVTKALKDGHF